MKSTDHGTRNLFATFSLRGGRLRKHGRGVVSYAPFLMGAASAVVLASLLFASPSLAQSVDRLEIAAVDDVVAGDEGWIIAIDDVAADAGGWITAIDDVATGARGRIAAYAVETGGGFAAFGDVVAGAGGGIATFGKVEKEITAFVVKAGAVASVAGSGAGDESAEVEEINGDKIGEVEIAPVVIVKSEDETPSVDDVATGLGAKTIPAGDDAATTIIITTATTTIANTDIATGITTTVNRTTPVDYKNTTAIRDTTIVASGTVSGGETGMLASRTGGRNLTLKNYADVDNVYYGIEAMHGGEGILDIVNHGKITNAEYYGISAVRAGKGVLKIHSIGEISAGERGISALHNDGDGGNSDTVIDIFNEAVVASAYTGIRTWHNGAGNVQVHNVSQIDADGIGVRADHEGSGNMTIRNASRIESGDVGICANHEGSGEIRIYLSGEVSSSTGNAIHMIGEGSKTLTLRPGFSLDGAAVSSGGGEGILELGQMPDNTAAYGVLDLGDDNFLGFDKFAKTGGNVWVVSGDADENNEAFESARIEGGTLRLSDATFSMSGYLPFFNEGGTLEIFGDSILKGNLKNAEYGEIVFGRAGERDTLTITGDYRDDDGLDKLTFKILPTGWDRGDKLTIEGNAPEQGIDSSVSVEIVEPEGGVASDSTTITLPDSHALIEVKGYASEYEFGGEEIIGAYRYVLKHDFADGVNRWHFRQNGLSTSAETASDVPSELADLATVEVDREGGTKGGIWGQQHSLRASLGTALIADSRLRIRDDRVHFGFDIPATSLVGGGVVVGASIWQGFSTSSVSSGNGAVVTKSHAAAMTASWRPPDGFYADGQVQYVRFSSDVSVEGVSLVQENEGMGVSISAQIGYRFAIPLGGMDFRLSPQMGLVRSRVGFDDFVGSHGELVSLEDGDVLTGLLGLSWDGEWRAIGGSGHVYGEIDLRGALDGRTTVNVSGASLTSEEGLSVDGRLGVSYDWDEGYAIHGEVVALRHGDAEKILASLGMRIDF